jgi:thiol-disulfide isomerase/thioredoxin
MTRRRDFLGAAALAAIPVRAVPDFRGRTLDGLNFSRTSLRGKPVLVQFWATWCGYCRRDQPAVEEIVEEFAGKLIVLAVSVKETEETVRRYLKTSPRKSRIVLSKDTNLVELLGSTGFPYYVLIGAESQKLGEILGAAGRDGLLGLLGHAGLGETAGRGLHS